MLSIRAETGPSLKKKRVVNKPNTRSYPDPNLSQARKVFSCLIRAPYNVVNARLEISSSEIVTLP